MTRPTEPRSMTRTFKGMLVYTSTFSPMSGVVVRTFARSTERYNNSILRQHPQYSHGTYRELEAAWEDEFGERSEAYPVVPEVLDVKITNECGFGCSYCLDPETPVLMADLSWKCIGELQPGDRVVGFDEHTTPGSKRKHRVSVVERVQYTVKPAFKIITSHGDVIASADHPWLVQHGAWVETSGLIAGMSQRASKIRHIGFQHNGCVYGAGVQHGWSRDYMLGYFQGITEGDGTCRLPDPTGGSNHQVYWRLALVDREPLERTVEIMDSLFGISLEIKPFSGGVQPMSRIEIRSREQLETIGLWLSWNPQGPPSRTHWARGYIAGMIDAEGATDKGRSIRICQNPGETYERICEALDVLRYRYTREDKAVLLLGGRGACMRLWAEVLPSLTRKMPVFDDCSIPTESTEVYGVIPLGEMDLVDIQTSTRTFYANGLASHNCYMDSKPKVGHPNSVELMEAIFRGCGDTMPYQIAFGGGEPTSHPDFPRILRMTAAQGIVPNYTTAGHIFRPEVIAATNDCVGGVSLTYHRHKGIGWFAKTYRKWQEALDPAVTLAIHVIADCDVATSIRELVDALGSGIHIILLAYYPSVGRGTMRRIMPKQVYMHDLPAALKETGVSFAFSEGLLPYFISRQGMFPNLVSTFMGPQEGLFSAYVDEFGSMSTSSFSPPEALDELEICDFENPEQFEKRKAEMYRRTVFGTPLRDLWKGHQFRYRDGSPNGPACSGRKYGDDEKAQCVTHDPNHQFVCAWQEHNSKSGPPLSKDAIEQKAFWDRINAQKGGP